MPIDAQILRQLEGKHAQLLEAERAAVKCGHGRAANRADQRRLRYLACLAGTDDGVERRKRGSGMSQIERDIEEMKVPCERLFVLLNDPHPGLATWMLATGGAMRELRDLLSDKLGE